MKKEIWHILKIIDVIIIVISGIPAIVLGTMFEIDHALPEKVFKILNICLLYTSLCRRDMLL